MLTSITRKNKPVLQRQERRRCFKRDGVFTFLKLVIQSSHLIDQIEPVKQKATSQKTAS